MGIESKSLYQPFHKDSEPQQKREQFRKEVFPELIATHVLEHVTDDLRDAGFTAEELREIQHAFLDLSEEQKKSVLALPAQLRPRLFEKYAQRLKKEQ